MTPDLPLLLSPLLQAMRASCLKFLLSHVNYKLAFPTIWCSSSEILVSWVKATIFFLLGIELRAFVLRYIYISPKILCFDFGTGDETWDLALARQVAEPPKTAFKKLLILRQSLTKSLNCPAIELLILLPQPLRERLPSWKIFLESKK